MRQVFVTGGSGYLGRNVIRKLVADGVTVHAIGRSKSALSVIEGLGAKAFAGSLADVPAMMAAAAGCDTAIHCAASVETSGDLSAAREANVQGTRNAMQAALKAGVQRAVHVGTEAGCLKSSGEPLRQLSDLEPLPERPFWGVYSTSKNEAERAAASFDSGSMRVTTVRPRLIWGKDDTVVLKGFVEAAESGVLQWFDGGTYLSSTCHVDNAVEGILKAALHGKPRAAYFLTDGEPLQFKAFISKMLSSVGVTPPTASVPSRLIWVFAALAENVCKLFGCKPMVDRQQLVLVGQEMTVSDATARAELGYRGHITVERGMEDLAQRHQAQLKEPPGKAPQREL